MPGVKEVYQPVRVGGENYEAVAASQTDQVLGTAGAKGDFLARLVVAVATAATSTVSVTDGTTVILAVPAVTPVGIYTVELGIRAVTGPWKITTGAGVSVLAIGQFSV